VIIKGIDTDRLFGMRDEDAMFGCRAGSRARAMAVSGLRLRLAKRGSEERGRWPRPLVVDVGENRAKKVDTEETDRLCLLDSGEVGDGARGECSGATTENVIVSVAFRELSDLLILKQRSP